MEDDLYENSDIYGEEDSSWAEAQEELDKF